jgi:hypothetical protein
MVRISPRLIAAYIDDRPTPTIRAACSTPSVNGQLRSKHIDPDVAEVRLPGAVSPCGLLRLTVHRVSLSGAHRAARTGSDALRALRLPQACSPPTRWSLRCRDCRCLTLRAPCARARQWCAQRAHRLPPPGRGGSARGDQLRVRPAARTRRERHGTELAQRAGARIPRRSWSDPRSHSRPTLPSSWRPYPRVPGRTACVTGLGQPTQERPRHIRGNTRSRRQRPSHPS